MPLSVGFSGNESKVDLEALRDHLRKMKDTEFDGFIRAAEYMCRSRHGSRSWS